MARKVRSNVVYTKREGEIEGGLIKLEILRGIKSSWGEGGVLYYWLFIWAEPELGSVRVRPRTQLDSILLEYELELSPIALFFSFWELLGSTSQIFFVLSLFFRHVGLLKAQRTNKKRYQIFKKEIKKISELDFIGNKPSSSQLIGCSSLKRAEPSARLQNLIGLKLWETEEQITKDGMERWL